MWYYQNLTSFLQIFSITVKNFMKILFGIIKLFEANSKILCGITKILPSITKILISIIKISPDATKYLLLHYQNLSWYNPILSSVIKIFQILWES